MAEAGPDGRAAAVTRRASTLRGGRRGGGGSQDCLAAVLSLFRNIKKIMVDLKDSDLCYARLPVCCKRSVTRIGGTMDVAMATSPGPTTIPREGQEQRSRSRALDPYAVILHNDDVNSMDHVVRSLMRSVPGL